MIRMTRGESIHGANLMRISQWRFAMVAMALFCAAMFVTLTLWESMATMSGMPMPGDWTMSMMWMRMPGQTWSGAAALFMGMWTPMMTAMMLPVLVPMLLRYRRSIHHSLSHRREALTFAVGSSYFVVWATFGLATFVIGAMLASLEMRIPMLARNVPFAAGIIIAVAGMLQLTPWKSRQLQCCEHEWSLDASSSLKGAIRGGLHFGIRCVYCCAPLTAMLLAFGMMDRKAMVVVCLATVLERTPRFAARTTQVTGVIATTTGLWLAMQAVS
jgi:predicted metal-binding membrane protein